MAATSVEAVRRFNRFYTKTIGTLHKGLVNTSYSLVEARVLYEVANRSQPTASAIAGDLALDPGYLSRILQSLETRRLLTRKASDLDRRQSFLLLTRLGRSAFSRLDKGTNQDIASLLQKLSSQQQGQLLQAMHTVETLLEGSESHHLSPEIYELRSHRAGDLGWIVSAHGALYAEEYGFNNQFEALVARIIADFVDNYDEHRERCWIAERNGERVGSVLLVKHPEMPDRVAKLRLLLVKAEARGLGIGRRLVRECSQFARDAGYQKITLWTNSVLNEARRLYEAEGYTLVHEEPHHSFGKGLVGQTWELALP